MSAVRGEGMVSGDESSLAFSKPPSPIGSPVGFTAF